jgi:hypothetical protein
MDEWMKKMWCIHTMKYSIAIKKNEILAFAATWMDLEVMMLSDISQVKTKEYHMFIFRCGIQQC